jgi:hypothetical protein
VEEPVGGLSSIEQAFMSNNEIKPERPRDPHCSFRPTGPDGQFTSFSLRHRVRSLTNYKIGMRATTRTPPPGAHQFAYQLAAKSSTDQIITYVKSAKFRSQPCIPTAGQIADQLPGTASPQIAVSAVDQRMPTERTRQTWHLCPTFRLFLTACGRSCPPNAIKALGHPLFM